MYKKGPICKQRFIKVSEYTMQWVITHLHPYEEEWDGQNRTTRTV